MPRQPRLYRHAASTPRRLVTAGLWYIAGTTAASASLYMAGLPMDVAPLFGLAAGGLVYADPTYVIWGRRRTMVEDLPTVDPATAVDPGLVPAAETRPA